jgi:hypothetical protein
MGSYGKEHGDDDDDYDQHLFERFEIIHIGH